MLVGEWCYMVHGVDEFSFRNRSSFIFQTIALSGRKAIEVVLQEMLVYECPCESNSAVTAFSMLI